MNENETAFVDEEFDVDMSEYIISDDDGDGNQTEPEAQTEETEAAENHDETDNDADGGDSVTQEEEPGDDAGTPAKAEELFTLKYNKEYHYFDREKVTELAQKGMNYDALHQKYQDLQDKQKVYDEMDGAYQVLDAIAKEEGVSIEKLLDGFQLARYRKGGASESEAQAKLETAKLRRQLEQKQAKKEPAPEEPKPEPENALKEKARRDTAEFLKIYKDVDIKKLPKEVLRDAQQTSLVSAYGKYENQQLRKQVEELQQKLNTQKKNTENKQKSTGSVNTDGAEGARDPFLDALMGDD